MDNEKYAFRCFLLRLGFIGAEYKAARKVLLRNLTGSSAFKSGKRGGADDAVFRVRKSWLACGSGFPRAAVCGWCEWTKFRLLPPERTEP